MEVAHLGPHNPGKCQDCSIVKFSSRYLIKSGFREHNILSLGL